MVNLASWIFPELKLEWLVEETKKNLPCELNFIMEGENAEKTSGLMKHLPWLHVYHSHNFKRAYIKIKLSYSTKFLQIPKIYWDLSTSRVLTMEYCEGFEIGVLGQGKKTEFEPYKKEISQKITKLYSDMIFLHGYVHCDPHPG